MSSDDRTVTRRDLLIAALVATSSLTFGPPLARVMGQRRRNVTVLRATDYDNASNLVDLLVRGMSDYPEAMAAAKGGRVVLKPNLVEFNPTRPINTDPRFIAAVIEAFRKMGAAEVVVGEAPGHRRDTYFLLHETGLGEVLREHRARFVDLNVDETSPVKLVSNLTKLGELHLPRTILGADLVVSLPKLKSHHWAGATLSMKNLFGVVPGGIYGWPKNVLHWTGIPQAIVDLWSTVNPGFAIVDGIVGMEGDGPIMGSAVQAGMLVMGDHLPAVDVTCAALMGLRPDRLTYLALAGGLDATVSPWRIENLGEQLDPLDFAVEPHMAFLKG